MAWKRYMVHNGNSQCEWLHPLYTTVQGLQLTTNTKKVTHPCFAGNNVWAKNAFFQSLKKYDFSLLRQKFTNSVFWNVPFERTWKILNKQPTFFIKVLSTICENHVNIFNFCQLCCTRTHVSCTLVRVLRSAMHWFLIRRPHAPRLRTESK